MSHPHPFGFFSLVRQSMTNRPWRNLAAVAAHAIIAGTLFSAQYLMSGARQSLDSGIDRMGADIMVVPREHSAAGESVLLTGQPTTFFFKDTGFEQIAQVAGAKTITPDGLPGTITGRLGSVTSLLHGSAMVASELRMEVAILKALGATRLYILRLMLTESLTLSIAGGLAGIGIAAVILLAFQDFIALNLKIPFIIPSPAAILAAAGSALMLSAGIGGIASLWPAYRISRSQPYETIRKGES
jgi:hypothetical protein